MIELTTMIWFAVGLLAGLVHATVLWRSVHQINVWSPLIGGLRLGIVASSLVLAAINGAILANAGGWAAGFALLAIGFLVLAPRHLTKSSSAPSAESR